MNSVPLYPVLCFAGVLFCCGLGGILIRRDLIFVLMSLEVMLNAAGLAFIAASAYWKNPDGQIMFLFILATGAAEVAIGLSLVLRSAQVFKTVDADVMSHMKG